MNRFGRSPAEIALATLIVVLTGSAVGAQEASSSPQIATIPYVDKAFGFELQVPAGWSYDRTGFFGPGGSLGLLRGAAPDGRATLQILAFRELQLPSFPEWIDYFSQQLGSISGTQRVRVKGREPSERPAAYLVVEAQLGADRTRTLYYCVQFDQDTIWVFSYAAALNKTVAGGAEGQAADSLKEVIIPAEFSHLTDTLRVFYDPKMARQMSVALRRGKEYLASYGLQNAVRDLQIDEEIRYYKIRQANKPTGYLTRQLAREDEPLQRPGRISNAKEGLRVRERSYRFADDGTVHISKIDLFSSRDAETDLYEHWEALVAAPEAGEAKPLITCDQCVREGDDLFSTYSTSQDRGLPEPRRPLKLDPTYLGLAWARLLPALLGPEPGQMHAFTVYDPETRTLITHAITPLGERPLPGRPEKKGLAFELRTGFVETPGIVYTDSSGNMLRFEAGEYVLELTDRGTIEKEFGPRRDAANARLQPGA